MSELTDVVARVETAVRDEIAAVATALGAPNPDVADAVTRLNAVVGALNAETAHLTPSAPAPAPAPVADTPAPAADAPAPAANTSAQ